MSMPKKVVTIDHDRGFKGSWYRTGQVFVVEDDDASDPHLPGYYQPIGLDHGGTIPKDHCSVLKEGIKLRNREIDLEKETSDRTTIMICASSIDDRNVELVSSRTGVGLKRVEKHCGGNATCFTFIYLAAVGNLDVDQFLKVFHSVDFVLPKQIQLFFTEPGGTRIVEQVEARNGLHCRICDGSGYLPESVAGLKQGDRCEFCEGTGEHVPFRLV